VSFARGIDEQGPLEPVGRGGATQDEVRRRTAVTRVAAGTLACPSCDAPTAPLAHPLSPVEQLDCGFCRHRAPVRDFLSLEPPTRPTRVVVRIR